VDAYHLKRDNRDLFLTRTQIANRRQFMNTIQRNKTVRILTAMLIAVSIIILSMLAAHAPAERQSSLTLASIRTDNTTLFYADKRPACAWFVEAVADRRPTCAWFVEAVLPTGDNGVGTDNLKSVAAAL
jgi:hypothetical protein